MTDPHGAKKRRRILTVKKSTSFRVSLKEVLFIL